MAGGSGAGGRIIATCERGRFGWIHPVRYSISGPKVGLLLPNRGAPSLEASSTKPGLNRSGICLGPAGLLGGDLLAWFLGSSKPVLFERCDEDGCNPVERRSADRRDHFEA